MTYRNKLFFSIFFTSIFIAVLFLFLSYQYLSEKIKTDYLDQYEFAINNLASSLNQLELQTDKILEGSANYLALYVEKNGVPSEEELQTLKKQLQVNEVYLINNQGFFIRSTKEPARALPNFFGFCPLYREWYKTGQSFIPTGLVPGIPSGIPFKFFTTVTSDKKYLIEIGIQTDFIGKSLQNIASNDKNILSIELYSPNGTGLGSFSQAGISYNKNYHFTDDTPKTLIGKHTIEINKNVPANFEFCCSCIRRGITLPDQKYFYKLRLVVSTKPLGIYYHRLLYIFLLSAFSCLLFSYFVSKFLSNILISRIKRIDAKIDGAIQSKNFEPRLEVKGDDEISHLAKHFNHMLEAIFEKQKRETENEKKAALGQIAKQVAHDIRSPLLVLKRILNDLPSLPEKKRIDARNAMQRVTDIANNLLSQYRQEKSHTDLEGTLSSEPVAIMLESIVSEKRIQVADLGVEITLEVLPNAYDAFVQVDIAGFKRVLSNLMNNAIDAVKDKQGQVTLALRKSDSSIFIDIKDNGCGIPKDKLLSVLEEGVSFGKKEGSGLGLPYAVSKISEWHGDYALTSTPGEGTQFEIILPECKPAGWFRSEIAIEKNTAIVILDDDDYIHQIWDERFSAGFLQRYQLEIFHFNNPQSFIEFCQGKTFNKTIFLLDYKLGKYQETGLTLAKMLNIGQYATLVTSRYEDEDVRENCKKLGMKIIPKSFAELTPIRIFEPTEIIFIDDEEIIGEFWKDSAESAGKSISIFQDPRDFMRIVHLYPKDVLIYMDSSLGNGLKGEDFAKQLYEQGYQNIFLATGFSKDHFKDVTWIKGVIGKEPPWG